MALYNIEIIEAPGHPKALAIICGLANVSRSEARRRLHRLPMIVQAAAPLSEAVSIQRQLARVGVQTRIMRSDVGLEDSSADLMALPPSARQSQEIIEIPDSDVTILDATAGSQPRIVIRKERLGQPLKRRQIIMAASLLVALVVLAYLWQSHRRARRIESDVAASITEWKTVLQDQDALLDRGITPAQIVQKLSEIEHKLESLWALLNSAERAEKYRREFEQTRDEARQPLLDLQFRRGLERADIPIHPTCSIDQGRVRGYSNLPDGTRLRVRLFGHPGVEAAEYSAQIQDRIFQLVLEPSIEGSVYDARATISPLTQQPAAVQVWAGEIFELTENGRLSRERSQPAPSGAFQAQPESYPELGAAGSSDEGSPSLSATSDEEISQALDASLMEWEKTLQAAHENLDLGEEPSLERIFQQLLIIEARIDQLLGLLQSPSQRDSCNLKRHALFGEFRSLRHELGQRHQDFLSARSPYILESRLQRAFQGENLEDVQVVVVDSPHRTGAFTIEIESGGGRKQRGELWPLLSRIIAEETQRIPLDLDGVRLQEAGSVRFWPMPVIIRAAESLAQAQGEERCLEILEGSGSAGSRP